MLLDWLDWLELLEALDRLDLLDRLDPLDRLDGLDELLDKLLTEEMLDGLLAEEILLWLDDDEALLRLDTLERLLAEEALDQLEDDSASTQTWGLYLNMKILETGAPSASSRQESHWPILSSTIAVTVAPDAEHGTSSITPSWLVTASVHTAFPASPVQPTTVNRNWCHCWLASRIELTERPPTKILPRPLGDASRMMSVCWDAGVVIRRPRELRRAARRSS